MTIEFEYVRAPRYRLVTNRWKGPYSEKAIRSHFAQVARWAQSEGLRTGRWVFREPGARVWDVGIEVPGTLRPPKPMKRTELPAARVASVTYDPEVVSPSVIWHGLNDWLKWQKKDRKVRSIGGYREVYEGDPWSSKKAWSRLNVQVVVKP